MQDNHFSDEDDGFKYNKAEKDTKFEKMEYDVIDK
jgi:hypothetical protein